MLVANVNSPAGEQDPTLSASGLELYFASWREAGSFGDIYVATRGSTNEPFEAPAPVAILNTAETESGPELSYDGLELFFARRGRILVSKRSTIAAAWGPPAFTDIYMESPSLTPDALTMYFTDRSCNPTCIQRSFRATRNSAWSKPEGVVIPAHLDFNDVDISSDGLAMVMSTALSGTTDKAVISRRPTTSSEWQTIEGIPALHSAIDLFGASWGINDSEIYFAAKGFDGAENSDIVVTVLQ
jgi:hypothetical protein